MAQVSVDYFIWEDFMNTPVWKTTTKLGQLLVKGIVILGLACIVFSPKGGLVVSPVWF